MATVGAHVTKEVCHLVQSQACILSTECMQVGVQYDTVYCRENTIVM